MTSNEVLMADDNKKQFSLDEVAHYFDAEARNRLDRGNFGRKNAEVLALKEKLFSLKDEQFEFAIKALKNMIKETHEAPSKEGGREKTTLSQEEKRRQLIDLVNTAENQADSADLPIKPI